ncbi:MAG: PEP/pyruvate-binding domain-containing protein [Myxococcota bacterium]
MLPSQSAILSLSQVRPTDRSRVGGKVLPLARLAADGLPVPPAVVLTTDVLLAVLRDQDLLADAELASGGDAAACARLHSSLRSASVPDALLDELRGLPSRLGGPVAVRSSGVAEDGEEQSFAGQHHTSLGIGADGMLDAVRQCWASLYAPGALAYRGGAGPDVAGMAVLVQRLIDPHVAGVLFTINPVNGSWREMTVEAVWGLAEGLVSGQVSPHWFVVRRPRRTPRPLQRVLARVRLQRVRADTHPIDRRWVRRGSGVEVEPVPASLRSRATLSPHDLRRLCRLGLRVEAHLGAPQDVEWALDNAGRLWVLQARPITTAKVPRHATDVVWTRRFVGERFPEPLTPLAWSLFEPTLNHFIAYPDVQKRYLGGGPALRIERGHVYLNATVFPHLAFKMPGQPPPRFLLELMPPEDAARLKRRFAAMPDTAVYGAIFRTTFEERRARRFAWNPFRNPDVWDRFERTLDDRLNELGRTPTSGADAVELVEQTLELLRRYVGIHVCSLLFANLFDQVLEGMLSLWVEDGASDLRDALATTPAGNKTLEINQAVWELAQHASDADVHALERGEFSTDFGGRLQGFLGEYGQRSHASWDLFAPRWFEEPERLVPLLRAYQAGAVADPGALATEQDRRFEDATARLQVEVTDPVRGAVLDRTVRLLRRYLLLRENQRFHFERLQWVLRQTLDWAGETLCEQGVLKSPEQARFCTWDELRQCLQGQPSPVASELERRRDGWVASQATSVPAFLRGDEVLAPPVDARRLQGHGISPGRVRGRVRRVRTLAEGRALQPGEILVAPAVDPAWTPLFLVAGGAILELGSRLSHGAVVAREYGVPAVVNVDGALDRLHDGDEVTVDGTRGLVFVHN